METKIYHHPFLSQNDFYRFMETVDTWFTPPVSKSVNLPAYSSKLYACASFVVVKANEEIEGFSAFYRNVEARQLYITLIAVNPKMQGNGIGGNMLDALLKAAAGDFDSVALEVRKDNEKALRFYTKHGFVEQEIRGEKILMRKTI